MKIFLDVSDTQATEEHLLPLLHAVENMPLALVLLATQAQYTTVPELISIWDTSRTTMLRRGGAGRLTSVDVSIEISLRSERFKSNPDAMRILQVLSVLPNGALLEDLSSMTPGDLNVESAILPLLQVALAYRGLL